MFVYTAMLVGKVFPRLPTVWSSFVNDVINYSLDKISDQEQEVCEDEILLAELLDLADCARKTRCEAKLLMIGGDDPYT